VPIKPYEYKLGDRSMNMQINYVEFAAKDLEATKRFFQGVFGWKFEDYGPDYVAFSESGIECGIYRSPKSSKYESGGALIVLYAEELEETQRMVQEGGGEIVREIFSFPGGRRFHFFEPSGNELAVWSDK
jgi:predicted enzyme related to lactoylglutathione lyase